MPFKLYEVGVIRYQDSLKHSVVDAGIYTQAAASPEEAKLKVLFQYGEDFELKVGEEPNLDHIEVFVRPFLP